MKKWEDINGKDKTITVNITIAPEILALPRPPTMADNNSRSVYLGRGGPPASEQAAVGQSQVPLVGHQPGRPVVLEQDQTCVGGLLVNGIHFAEPVIARNHLVMKETIWPNGILE